MRHTAITATAITATYEEKMMDINAAAPVITRDEIFINALIDSVWDIQVDVAGWPSWRSDVAGSQITGALSVGAVFQWQTAGLDITSTVHEFDAPHRILWSGPAQGIVGVHVWTFDEQEGGVIVRTSESGGSICWSSGCGVATGSGRIDTKVARGSEARSRSPRLTALRLRHRSTRRGSATERSCCTVARRSATCV
jgi:hypothetical protein